MTTNGPRDAGLFFFAAEGQGGQAEAGLRNGMEKKEQRGGEGGEGLIFWGCWCSLMVFEDTWSNYES